MEEFYAILAQLAVSARNVLSWCRTCGRETAHHNGVCTEH